MSNIPDYIFSVLDITRNSNQTGMMTLEVIKNRPQSDNSLVINWDMPIVILGQQDKELIVEMG